MFLTINVSAVGAISLRYGKSPTALLNVQECDAREAGSVLLVPVTKNAVFFR